MTEIKFLIATTNQGKTKEIKSHLEELPLEVISLQELQSIGKFAEKGATFLENATGKSLFYSQKWEGLTLAEDSGLEIEHLKGAPGVLSARFSDPHATDDKNNTKVLKLMEGVPFEERKAKFVSCIVLTQKGIIIKKIQEYVWGFITSEKKGSNGFGYDPIFFYPPFKKTFAALSPERKNEVSHRGRALRKLIEFLQTYLS